MELTEFPVVQRSQRQSDDAAIDTEHRRQGLACPHGTELLEGSSQLQCLGVLGTSPIDVAADERLLDSPVHRRGEPERATDRRASAKCQARKPALLVSREYVEIAFKLLASSERFEVGRTEVDSKINAKTLISLLPFSSALSHRT